MIEIKVEGLAELRRALLELPKELQDKEVKRAVFAGAKIVREEAKTNVGREGLYETGSLHDAIRYGFDKVNSSGVQKTVRVFVKHKMKKYANTRANRRAGIVGNRYAAYGTLFYWRFLEFGTRHIPAKRFMRNAFDTTIQRQIAAIALQLGKGIERQAARLKRQAARLSRRP